MSKLENELDPIEYEKFRQLWLDDLAAIALGEVLKAYRSGGVEMSPQEACMVLYRAFIYLAQDLSDAGHTDRVSIMVAMNKMNKEMGWFKLKSRID